MTASPDRPRIAAGLLAGLLAAAPARVRRRLDAEPDVAEGWEWRREGDGWEIAAGAETVRLAGALLTGTEQVCCGCLLSPRCLHLLAVLSVLEAAEQAADAAAEPSGDGAADSAAPAGPVAPRLDTAVDLSADALAAARLAWEAAADVLATGVRATDSLHRAELLRASALSRAARLPRLAALCAAAATGLRDQPTPRFSLDGHAATLAELLDVAWRLGGGPDRPRPAPTRAEVGTGRRDYAELGSLRLYGLASESVVTRSGYAGVVSHVVSADGDGSPVLWRIGDVVPGRADRVRAVYRTGVAFGGLSLAHHELGRTGVFAQRVTASPDGRLGSGTGTTASGSAGVTWWQPPLTELWTEPLAAQLTRALAAVATPGGRTGADLLFLDATVAGSGDHGELLAVEGGTSRVLRTPPPATLHRTLAANLTRLAALPGLPLRLVARPVRGRPGLIRPVAAAVPAGQRLPAAWAGRINLDLDEIAAGHLTAPAGRAAPPPPAHSAPDAGAPVEPPLDRYERTLRRLAEGGRAALIGAGATAARLRRAHLPTAADLLAELAAAARERRRTATGESVAPGPDRLALAWLAAMTYADAARASLDQRAWLAVPA
ncbi:hypothetical protein [Marinactinospora rubrisoli]|uniref:SWIM-type domain-containing protein n=1 Tax=Marinactinospora rubrisoli TaxID=2715399 RepID=A0ABW2KMK5_9ACTN